MTAIISAYTAMVIWTLLTDASSALVQHIESNLVEKAEADESRVRANQLNKI